MIIYKAHYSDRSVHCLTPSSGSTYMSNACIFVRYELARHRPRRFRDIGERMREGGRVVCVCEENQSRNLLDLQVPWLVIE